MSKLKIWSGVCDWYGPSQHVINYQITKECPDQFQIVNDFSEADICIDFIIGDPDRNNLVHPAEKEWSEMTKFRAFSGLYKNIYVVLCNIIDSPFYRHVFQDSVMAYTYINKNMVPFEVNENIYFRGPLGIDAGLFSRNMIQNNGALEEIKREFLIYCFGTVASTESLDIIFEAVREASMQTGIEGKMLHSGIDLEYDSKHYTPAGVSDPRDRLAVPYKYSISYFANALRRDAAKEGGFELGNLEAPLCDCRPISYSIEPFQHWFKDTSLFVSLDKTKSDLVQIFSNTLLGKYDELYAVTTEHKLKIVNEFSWYQVVQTFWDEVCKRV